LTAPVARPIVVTRHPSRSLFAPEKLDLLKGTLDLLVLQVLSSMGGMHGYGIARRLEQVSGNELAMNEGTIYAALIRLQDRKLIKTTWGTSENDRRAKYYGSAPRR
jgi:PadR family transcriptional regulator, regulatory protein PadR